MQEIHEYSRNEGMNCDNHKSVAKSHIILVVEQRFRDNMDVTSQLICSTGKA